MLDYFEFTLIAGFDKKANAKDKNTATTTNGHYGILKVRMYYDDNGDISRYEVRTAGISKPAVDDNTLETLRQDDAFKRGN